ncbi:hypothetical protein ABFS82_12G094700 [Erythranthe guttata]
MKAIRNTYIHTYVYIISRCRESSFLCSTVAAERLVQVFSGLLNAVAGAGAGTLGGLTQVLSRLRNILSNTASSALGGAGGGVEEFLGLLNNTATLVGSGVGGLVEEIFCLLNVSRLVGSGLGFISFA